MENLEVWFCQNNLMINTDKTVTISFHTKQKRNPARLQVMFKNMNIAYKSEIQFLGINITENLKWNVQLNKLFQKLSKICYVIKTLKEVMSPYMIRCIYYAHFHSLVRSGIIFWGGDIENNKIFKLQKRVNRIISGTSRQTSCRQIFKDYNMLTVTCLYILEIVCFIKKYKGSLEQNVTFHNYNTRKKMDLHVQYCSKDLFKKSVVNMGIKLYNKVPDNIKDLENCNKFKKRV
jgi:hypothetical protein